MTVQENAYLSVFFKTVYIADVGKLLERLSFLINSVNDAGGRIWVIGSDVVVDVL